MERSNQTQIKHKKVVLQYVLKISRYNKEKDFLQKTIHSYRNAGAEVISTLCQLMVFGEAGVSFYFIDLLQVPIIMCCNHEIKLVTVYPPEW